MKIGMVCYPTVGGSGIVATRLGTALAARGHEVHFVSYERPFELDLKLNGIAFHPVNITHYELFKYPDYGLSLAVKLAHVAREHQLDIVHVHYAIPHAASAHLARMLLEGKGPAIMTTLHGTDISLIGRDPAFYDLVRHSIQASDAVTAVSEYLKEETLQTFHIERDVDVIPNFVLPTKPHATHRPPLLLPNKKVLIHVSNFRPVKRVQDVIRIFSRVQDRVDSQLLLVGDGSCREATQELATTLGIEDKVHFLGTRADVPTLLSHSDLFLLPSAQESFGLAALEAMAHGVPVIGTQSGGLPEIVRHAVDGVLCSVGDTDAMAAAALELLTDQHRYQELAAHGVQRAHETFSLAKVVSQYEECYQTIAATRLRRTEPLPEQMPS